MTVLLPRYKLRYSNWRPYPPHIPRRTQPCRSCCYSRTDNSFLYAGSALMYNSCGSRLPGPSPGHDQGPQPTPLNIISCCCTCMHYGRNTVRVPSLHLHLIAGFYWGWNGRDTHMISLKLTPVKRDSSSHWNFKRHTCKLCFYCTFRRMDNSILSSQSCMWSKFIFRDF